MQTFLPYPDFAQSLKSLDNKRLGKQRVETGQLLRCLGVSLPKCSGELPEKRPRMGWVNHPACRMWIGYETALMLYYNLSLGIWTARGFQNSMPFMSLENRDVLMPYWLGSEEFHSSHRSNLIRKDPGFYKRYGWTEGPDLPYVWPAAKERTECLILG